MPRFGLLTRLKIGREKLLDLNEELPHALLEGTYEELLKKHGLNPKSAGVARAARRIQAEAHTHAVNAIPFLQAATNPQNRKYLLPLAKYFKARNHAAARLSAASGLAYRFRDGSYMHEKHL